MINLNCLKKCVKVWHQLTFDLKKIKIKIMKTDKESKETKLKTNI